MQILLFVFSALFLFATTGILGKLMYNQKDTLFSYSTYYSYSDESRSLSGNFILKTFFPCVFIVALSWLLQILHLDEMVSNVWLVVAFYWVFRMIWLIVIFNRASLTNFAYETASFLISVGSAFFVYKIFIDYCIQNGISVFLSRDELRSGVAFALLLYAINIVWKILNKNGLFSQSNIYRDSMILNDLKSRTNKLVLRYGSIVHETLFNLLDANQLLEKESFITKLVFSIMIVEDRNRPFFVRVFENILHRTLMKGKPMSVGVMQVKSISNLNDRESIREAIKIILDVIFEDTSNSDHDVIEDSAIISIICQKYNPSFEYSLEVEFIYDTISEWLNVNA